MSESIKTRMTAAEFRQLPETNQFIELINGEVIMSPSPLASHQDIAFNLAVLLRAEMPHGKTSIAPMDVYLDDVNAVQPDVFWRAEDSQCVERDGYFYGAPELVVEVLSPATSTRDRREKFALYEKHGVLEYWMADPDASHIEVWQREGKTFTRLGIVTDGETFTSSALGKSIKLDAIFA